MFKRIRRWVTQGRAPRTPKPDFPIRIEKTIVKTFARVPECFGLYNLDLAMCRHCGIRGACKERVDR